MERSNGTLQVKLRQIEAQLKRIDEQSSYNERQVRFVWILTCTCYVMIFRSLIALSLCNNCHIFQLQITMTQLDREQSQRSAVQVDLQNARNTLNSYIGNEQSLQQEISMARQQNARLEDNVKKLTT